MKISAKLTLGVMLLLLLSSNTTAAQEASQAEPTASVQADVVTVPDISEVIPMAAELSGKLAALENKVQNSMDLSLFEKKYIQIQTDINIHVREFQGLKNSGDYRTTKLIALRQEIEKEGQQLNVISKPLKKEINRLGTKRQQWLTEQHRWEQWQSAWLESGAPDQVHLVVTKANETIAAALDLIGPQLEAILTEQQKVGDIQEQLYALDAELENLIMDKRFGTFLYSSPPMFSSRYFSQFNSDLWRASLEGFSDLLWSDSHFFHRLGWATFLEILAFIVLTISISRKRQVLRASEHWRFIADRTWSTGLFLVCTTMMVIYEYEEIPFSWKILNLMIICVSFARLAGSLTVRAWEKEFVYGLAIFLVAVRFMEITGFPLPLFRLFIVLAAATGLISCWKWARQHENQENQGLYPRLFQLGGVFLGIILVAEIWGKDTLAFYLIVSVTRSIAIVLVFMLFIRIIHGAVEWLFHSSLLPRAVVLYSNDIDSIVQRIMNFFSIAVCGLILLPSILMLWGLFDSLPSATKGFWEFGFNIGSQRISVGLVIVVIALLYGSFVVSWIFQKIFLDILLRKRKVQRGVRLSIERLVHYFVIFIRFLLAISLFGFDLTKFTIILSALGVGIGFGLQGVVNNFVSGLILLFEQPVRQGDIIEVGGIWAEVKNIGLRATTVQTFDQADLIIPTRI